MKKMFAPCRVALQCLALSALCLLPAALFAESIPLVNTEAFTTIDDADASSDLFLQFGSTVGKSITYERGQARFVLDDDVHMQGGLTVQGTASGLYIYATDGIASSGTIVVEGDAHIGELTPGAPLLVVSGSRIAVGNTNPSNLLSVGDGVLSQLNGKAVTISNATGEAVLSIGQSPTARGRMRWIYNASEADAYLVLGDSAGTHDLVLQDQGGNTGIGVLNPETLLEIGGTMSGVSLTVGSLKGCDSIDTDANGVLQCGTDAGGSGLSQTDGDARYVRRSGGSMTGGLVILSGNPAATVDSGLLLEVVGTASGRILHAHNLLTSSGSLSVEGGAAFDKTTLRVDASNNRVGILTAAPETALEVVGTMSGTSLTVGSLKNCDTIDTDGNGAFSCGTDETGGGGGPDTATAVDSDPAAWNGDNNTVELFDDANPSIVTDSTSSTVLVTVNIEGNTSNTSADSNLAARIVATTNGDDPSCSTSAQVGEDMVSNFTTTTAQYWSNIEGTFLHSPGVAGTMTYTVCSSAAGGGTMTDTATSISITLVELGS